MLQLLLVLFLLLSGCTFSTSSIHMNAELIFDEALVGT